MNDSLPQILKLATDYGVTIIILYFLIRFFIWLVRYVFERNKEREQCYMEILKNDLKHLTESMNTLTVNLSNFADSTREAQRYTRDEHKEMTEILVGLDERIDGKK